MISSIGRRRRRRILDEDERRLWERVAESVDPLDPDRRGRAGVPVIEDPEASPPPPEPSPPPPEPVAVEPEPLRRRVTVRPSPPPERTIFAPVRPIHVKHRPGSGDLPPPVVAPPALAPIDDRTRRRLVRGTMAIDERMDLHGLTQDAAHSALRYFLVTARARGARIVLVITGKGRGGPDPQDRGILRRAVPHWLAEPALRDVVVGFEEAHLAHGGAGAIYVRLRRLRRPEGGER